MRSEELYLQDIIEAIILIEGFLTDITENKFFADELLQSAVLYQLMIIGEASSRVSGKLKSKYPEIEWKEIIGFRNIVVHAYFSLNKHIIWATVSNRIAPLRRQIQLILQKEYPVSGSASEQ